MFRDNTQKAACCRQLCELVGRFGLWNAFGPTDVALEFRDNWRKTATEEERVVILAAWDIWDGTGHCPLAHLIEIGGRPLLAVAMLLKAMAQQRVTPVDQWLAEFDPRKMTLEFPAVDPVV